MSVKKSSTPSQQDGKSGEVSGATSTLAANNSGTVATAAANVGTLTSSFSVSTVQSGAPATGLRLKLQQMLAGVQAVLPAGSSITVSNGTPLTQAQMVSTLTSDLALYAGVDGLKTSLSQARQSLKAQEASFLSFYNELKAALLLFYKKGNPALAQFGIQSKAGRTPLTSAKALVKAERAAQTKQLRGTLTKKEKAETVFTGQVGISTTANAPAGGSPAAGITPPAVSTPAVPAAVSPTVVGETPGVTPAPAKS